jgi:hypothetical protein
MVEMKQIRSVQSNIPINHNTRYRTGMRRATWKNDLKKKSYNHKHELPVAAMFVNESGRNERKYL